MPKITPFVSALGVVVTCSLIHPQAVAGDQTVCNEVTCDKCLREKHCVWMHNGTCTNECETFPDHNCYFPRMFGSPLTNRFEICEIDQDLHSDNHRCFQQQNEKGCRNEIGCVWLNGVQKSGETVFWCALHLESAAMFQRHPKTYPPTEPLVEVEGEGEEKDEATEEELRKIHVKTTSVIESLLGFYALLPFCFWACWAMRVHWRDSDGYDEGELDELSKAVLPEDDTTAIPDDDSTVTPDDDSTVTPDGESIVTPNGDGTGSLLYRRAKSASQPHS